MINLYINSLIKGRFAHIKTFVGLYVEVYYSKVIFHCFIAI